MKKELTLALILSAALTAAAQEHLQREVVASSLEKTFTTLKENPVTSVKNQHRSGTWYMSRDYIALNTTYLFLNRHALPKALRKAVGR